MPDRLEILTRLLQDHVTARRVMAALEHEVDRVAQFHPPDAATISGAVYFFGAYMVGMHHSIEDMIYSALTRGAPDLAAEIKKVADEHDEAGALVSQLRDAAIELQADADRARVAFCRVARGLIAFERHHLRREESKFFIYAGEHLTPSDWRAIGDTTKGLEKTLAASAHIDGAARRAEQEASPRGRYRMMELRRQI
ncbi:MAG: hemerythrin domain-containing protein [Rhodospirillaceae bacterium]